VATAARPISSVGSISAIASATSVARSSLSQEATQRLPLGFEGRLSGGLIKAFFDVPHERIDDAFQFVAGQIVESHNIDTARCSNCFTVVSADPLWRHTGPPRTAGQPGPSCSKVRFWVNQTPILTADMGV